MNQGFELTAADIKVFLDEADEMLQGMEDGILNLEHHPDDVESLRALFRYAHTLKGSAATLGHQSMTLVAHAMENNLEPLRQGKGEATVALIDALLMGLDALRKFRHEIAGVTGEPADITAVLAALEQLNTAPAGEKPEAGGTAAAQSAELPAGLTDEQLAALRGVTLPAGRIAYWVTVQVDEAAAMRSVRAYQALLELEQLGQIAGSWPSAAELETNELGDVLRVLLVTDAAPDAVAAMVRRVPDVGDVKVEAARLAPEAAAPPAKAPRPAQAAEPGAQPGGAAVSSRTIRVDVAVLDDLMNLVGELVIDRTRLNQGLADQDSDFARGLAQTAAHIARVTSDLQEHIMGARMVPVETLFRKFPRMVRDLAQTLGKEIDLVMEGEETELDRAIMEEIGDPLIHLLRNALDHGIELPVERLKAGKPSKGAVHLLASHEEDRIVITIRDDGKGLDPQALRNSAVRKQLLTEEAARRLTDREALNLIFAPGFSTKEQVTDVSGRGVGMDVVKQNLDRLNASINITTAIGRGTEFRLKIPLTLAILRGILVRMLGEIYAIPISAVAEILDLRSYPVQTVRGRRVIMVRGEVVPLVTGEEMFGVPAPQEEDVAGQVAVMIHSGGSSCGLVVDGLLGQQEVVIKPLGKTVGEVPGLAGATIMGNGNIALILDVSHIGTGLSVRA